MRRVAVIGGGNAALCAALTARDAGADVTIFERAPQPFRGGNTRHTRNIRTLHRASDSFVTGPYEFEEFRSDLVEVTGADINTALAEKTIADSEGIVRWMEAHGARWQAPLKGTLGLARTNHFFLGGGKSLLNSYYRYAEDAGIQIHYESSVDALMLNGLHCTAIEVRQSDGTRRTFEADVVVVAAGGFEANREWLSEYWGSAARTLIVRGTPHNDGRMLQLLMEAGASTVGPPMGAHAIAVDARAPAYDAGIVTRVDAIPLGIVVNCDAARFFDEGQDIWPKRYAVWGRLIAEQPDDIAYVIFDAKAVGETIPTLFPPVEAGQISELASQLGLDQARLTTTVESFNQHCRPGRFDLSDKDECRTEGLDPPKSHWARPIDMPPFYAYPLRPGITFTYMGVGVDRRSRIRTASGVFENLFAAGEIMSGNILTRGYLAGFGMTIGTVWGWTAGQEAARA